MSISESGNKLRKLINKAIEDCTITPEEYEEIINLSLKDGFVDPQERALLRELQQMIEHKEIRFSKKDNK
ncbi:MAG: hypothetical protein AB7S50_02740 [Bacteroidales bacterium]